MFIKSIKLNKFQLFREAEIKLTKVNLITGINQDDPEESSNASGKSTLAKNALLFCLYGNVKDLNLEDLIHYGEKETSVEIQIDFNNNHYKLIREIPTKLTIFENEKELEFNTTTLKQQFIDKTFGDIKFFKQFRTIDTSEGINLLDLGIISLRKTLMGFIDDLFIDIRKKLLDKKNERELYNQDKRLYKYCLSEKRKQVLNKGIEILTKEIKEILNNVRESDNIILNQRSESESKEKIISYKKKDIEKLSSFNKCPLCLTKLDEAKKKEIITSKSTEIDQLLAEIEKIKNSLSGDLDYKKYCQANYEELNQKLSKTRELLMKLNEAFKFANYKFTKKDVLIYTEAIKTIDTFAGLYINIWLQDLENIINELLKSINLSVSFTSDKDFLKIKDSQKEQKYQLLSSGQKIFLSSIFKLAILLQNGITDGVILADEGFGNMDWINLKKFLKIFDNLNFQLIWVYQNPPKDLENINIIEILRKNGVSIIK